ncbi:hypothetical protein HAL013_03010 [Helicobacter ailurogastricus]|uniref:Uncharacterized protein n=1 Tax=Helicobacter ailurogastricus TaxID=1578720 RepID=A0A0K2X6K2_9HELI|nr:hypothetical protein HAL011_15960 [Helicobacter ailurogastricus]CRF42142.1 hypothetical protein HAL013_03010 [Helicobacter ailurogastricus]CRF43474.1 hypothetical protein HAL09_00150 [Helicobacter ailurogastricus]
MWCFRHTDSALKKNETFEDFKLIDEAIKGLKELKRIALKLQQRHELVVL